ncbi:MAG: trypsin-like peptidase domain-containing protein [Actinomycetota bacterium]
MGLLGRSSKRSDTTSDVSSASAADRADTGTPAASGVSGDPYAEFWNHRELDATPTPTPSPSAAWPASPPASTPSGTPLLPPPPMDARPVAPVVEAKLSRRRTFLVIGLAFCVAWLGGLGGALVGGRLADLWDRPPTRPSTQPLDIAEARDGFDGRIDVQAVADFIAPSTVTISADIGPGVGTGTGIILTEDGEILTNAHVVEGASEVRVRLAGESEPREATILAADRGNDLALLRIAGDGFVPARFADPDSIAIGDEVVAVGFALNLDGDPSVTLGIVSALDRSFGLDDVFLDGLIQTDAAISSGNSGGPLVNAAGEVVGVNTAVARNTAVSAATNISLAISNQEALPIIEALRAQADGEEREEAFLGVGLADRRDGGQGVIVTAVSEGTPAEEIGVEAGDLIVAVDGTATDGSPGLIAAIRDKQPGDTVTVTIMRGEVELDLDVTLTSRPDDG